MFLVKSQSDYSKTDTFLLLVGVLCTLLFSFFIFGPTQTHFDVSGLNVIGSLETPTGVKRRHARALAWEEVKKTIPIYTKDLVYTPPQSSAEVRLGDDKILMLEPDSLVEFEAINQENFDIVLLQGSGTIKLGQSEKTIPLKLKGGAPVEFKADKVLSLPQFYVDVETWSKAQSEYFSRASSVPLLTPLAEVKKIEDQLKLNLTDFILELLPATQLKDTGSSSLEGPWYELAWTQIPLTNITYELEISRTPQFNRLIQQNLKTTRVPAQFLEGGEHFWRVVAKHKNEELQTRSQVLNVTKVKRDE